MATEGRPWAIFLGACCAFVIQSFISVAFGSVFTLLPQKWVRLIAGLLFFSFAWAALRRSREDRDVEKFKADGTFWQAVLASFIVIFIAEWGDLTQLATASLEARYHSAIIVFTAAILSLWTVTGFAVIIGSHAKKMLNPKLLNRLAAIAFLCVGIYFAASGFR